MKNDIVGHVGLTPVQTAAKRGLQVVRHNLNPFSYLGPRIAKKQAHPISACDRMKGENLPRISWIVGL
jgi:hypothetical protein